MSTDSQLCNFLANIKLYEKAHKQHMAKDKIMMKRLKSAKNNITDELKSRFEDYDLGYKFKFEMGQVRTSEKKIKKPTNIGVLSSADVLLELLNNNQLANMNEDKLKEFLQQKLTASAYQKKLDDQSEYDQIKINLRLNKDVAPIILSNKKYREQIFEFMDSIPERFIDQDEEEQEILENLPAPKKPSPKPRKRKALTVEVADENEIQEEKESVKKASPKPKKRKAVTVEEDFITPKNKTISIQEEHKMDSNSTEPELQLEGDGTVV